MDTAKENNNNDDNNKKEEEEAEEEKKQKGREEKKQTEEMERKKKPEEEDVSDRKVKEKEEEEEQHRLPGKWTHSNFLTENPGEFQTKGPGDTFGISHLLLMYRQFTGSLYRPLLPLILSSISASYVPFFVLQA